MTEQPWPDAKDDEPIRSEVDEAIPRPHPASSLPEALRIAVLMGGANTERNASLSTGTAISRALRAVGHAVAAVDSAQSPALPGQDPDELFLSTEIAEEDLVDAPYAPTAAAPPDLELLAKVRAQQEDGILAPGLLPILQAADVVFVTVFGDEGESGRTQAFLERHGIAYTGPTPEVCELTFDKARTKQVLVDNGIATPGWHVVRRGHVEEDLGGLSFDGPWIVKPVGGGSTIGLSKVDHAAELPAACELASAEGRDALIEEFVEGRDLTIAALGERVFAAVEPITDREVFDYEAKYTPGEARKEVPANLPDGKTEELKELTAEVHGVLGIGETSSRADFRFTPDGRFLFLETNPLPGMTPRSSFPLSIGAEGITFPWVCEWLVAAALRRAGRPLDA
jgi:D-alanine-D-alanine ligase